MCRRLRAAGVEPFIADLDGTRARTLADELEPGWFALNVASMQSWTTCVTTDRRRRRGHGAGANAGPAGGRPADRFDPDRYRAMFAVNVDGV